MITIIHYLRDINSLDLSWPVNILMRAHVKRFISWPLRFPCFRIRDLTACKPKFLNCTLNLFLNFLFNEILFFFQITNRVWNTQISLNIFTIDGTTVKRFIKSIQNWLLILPIRCSLLDRAMTGDDIQLLDRLVLVLVLNWLQYRFA